MENELPDNRRPQYIGIDLLRFFAAVMVMLFHLVYLSSARHGTTYWISGGLISLPQAWSYTYWGWVGVQIFFVISGFVIALTAEKASVYSYLISRITRLVPGVWICAPLTYLLAAVLLHDPRETGLLHSIFFIPYGPWVEVVYWTLGIELSFYSVVLVLIFWRRFSLIREVAYVMGAASTAFWMLYTLVDMNAFPSFFTTLHHMAHSRLLELLLIHHGCEFAIGILLWQSLGKPSLASSKSVGSSKSDWVAIGIFAVGTVMQIMGHNVEENARVIHPYSPDIPILVWFATMAFLLWSIRSAHQLMQWPGWAVRLCRRLGLMTYPLYLIHLSFGAYVMGVFARHGFRPIFAAATGILLSITASWIISVYLEPPLQKLMRRWLSQT